MSAGFVFADARRRRPGVFGFTGIPVANDAVAGIFPTRLDLLLVNPLLPRDIRLLLRRGIGQVLLLEAAVFRCFADAMNVATVAVGVPD